MEIKWKSFITLQSEGFILFYNYNSEIVSLSFIKLVNEIDKIKNVMLCFYRP